MSDGQVQMVKDTAHIALIPIIAQNIRLRAWTFSKNPDIKIENTIVIFQT